MHMSMTHDTHGRRWRRRPIAAPTCARLLLLAATMIVSLLLAAGASALRPADAQARVQLPSGNKIFSSHHGVIRKRNMRHLGYMGATWYGPGFWGNRTGCGRTLKRRTWGVAHRTLPCGTVLFLKYKRRQIAVPVVDRGPYGTRLQLDLTARTAYRLGLNRAGHGRVRVAIMKHRRVPIKRL